LTHSSPAATPVPNGPTVPGGHHPLGSQRFLFLPRLEQTVEQEAPAGVGVSVGVGVGVLVGVGVGVLVGVGVGVGRAVQHT